jgi:hypothetical protein
MHSTSIFADQMAQRHESGQLEAAVRKVLQRVLRSGGDESSLRRVMAEKFEQLQESGSRLAPDSVVLDGLSRNVSDRLASSEVQAEYRAARRRGADTLDFGSTRISPLLESKQLCRR